MSKIYVGNLPFSADEAAVRTLFATHGTVESVALITDRDTGQPRGFGFVEMPNSDAARAIRLLFQPVLVVWALWCTGAWTWARAQWRARSA